MAELTTIARPYAKAAFSEALENKALAQWSDMLSLIEQITSDDAVAEVLVHPALTAQQQADTVIELCGDRLDARGKNFVTVLAEAKRLSLAGEIVEQFEQLKADLEKEVEVTVSAAFELSSTQQETLSQALKNKLHCDVRLTSIVDPELIGGAVIHAGDLVIDGSVRGKLAKLAKAMNS